MHLERVSPASTAALVYLVVLGSIVGFSAYAWLLRNARISLVGTYAFVNPAIAVLAGWLILGERLSLRTLLGGGIIVVAVALIVLGKSMRLELPRVLRRHRLRAGVVVEPDPGLAP